MDAIKNYFAGLDRIGYILAALTVLVVSDGLITNFLMRDGLAREGNPFLQSLVGSGNFLVIKVSGAFLCALILWDIYKRWRKLALIASLCFTALYTGILSWNLYLFFIF